MRIEYKGDLRCAACAKTVDDGQSVFSLGVQIVGDAEVHDMGAVCAGCMTRVAVELTTQMVNIRLVITGIAVSFQDALPALACAHNVNPETDRCVCCGKNAFQRSVGNSEVPA